MAALNFRQILEDADRFVQQKQAEYKVGMAGQTPGSMPGSENDKPAPSVSSDPEVKQDLPPGGTTNAGAADADKLESGQALDATQPGKDVPDKKPVDSADAMAEPKTGAAKLANDLLASIKNLQDSMKTAAAVDKDGVKPKVETPVVKTVPAVTGDVKKAVDAPKVADAADTPKVAEPVSQITLTQDVLAKVAAVILSTEAGWEFTEQALTKAAGAEAAREVINTLTKQAEDAEKQAAAEQGYADAQALILQSAERAGYEKAAAEFGKDDKLGKLYKLGQAVAEDALAGLGGAGGMPEGMPAEGMPEGDVAAEELAGMGAEPAGDEGISEEELAQALTELVQEGEIQPEEAEAILQYISQAGGAEGAGEATAAEEGALAEDDTAGDSAADQAAAGDVGDAGELGEEVQASAKKANIASLMEIIKEAKAKRDSAKTAKPAKKA